VISASSFSVLFSLFLFSLRRAAAPDALRQSEAAGQVITLVVGKFLLFRASLMTPGVLIDLHDLEHGSLAWRPLRPALCEYLPRLNFPAMLPKGLCGSHDMLWPWHDLCFSFRRSCPLPLFQMAASLLGSSATDCFKQSRRKYRHRIGQASFSHSACRLCRPRSPCPH
jgi:hypothetical protein